MIQINNKYNCCGCEACVQICPAKCLTLSEDSEGFWYPVAEKDKCIDCKLCEKVCPILNRPYVHKPGKVYAIKNVDEKTRINSSSGGLFIILSRYVISLGGVVFGARFNELGNVVHDYAESEDRLILFVGSKYVQSRIGDSFTKCRFFLQDGKWVLFSGTPCQITALKNFLGKEYDKLITVDLICHGVPSPKVWQRYLYEFVEECETNHRNSKFKGNYPLENLSSNFLDNKTNITGISFKNKSYGWRNYSLALTYHENKDNGLEKKVYLPKKECDNPYMCAFLSDWISRPSCYRCVFKGGVNKSDMTIGDFWGVEFQMPFFDDDKGVSLLIINNKKGGAFFDAIDKTSYIIGNVCLENAMKDNPSYYYPVNEPESRKEFFHLFVEGMSVKEIVGKMLYVSPMKMILQKTNRLLKFFIYKIKK